LIDRALKRGQSLPFLALVGDDLDQSPRQAFINCILSQNKRYFIHNSANYFSLSPVIFFIF
ncbi:hypothetical protein KQJ27_25295, partial [Pluralibacter sp. S54_ASV_43]|nr:hypothetical protein [Pluralibacter sp. S54_ASV_43]